MKRQIKFRGFCTTCKEKIDGDLIHGVGSKFGKFFILPIQHNLAGVQHCHPLDGVEVFPDSIGQFTGLQDINGKDIYEGDILRIAASLRGKVIYIDKNCKEYGDETHGAFHVVLFNHNKAIPFDSYLIENCTIIGNIYENPELLKTTENE